MIAHHSITGCPLQVGDLLGSGTISGTEDGSQGSMLERCFNGARPLRYGDHIKSFVEDGDAIVMEGWAENSDGDAVGFGPCIGEIQPATVITSINES